MTAQPRDGARKGVIFCPPVVIMRYDFFPGDLSPMSAEFAMQFVQRQWMIHQKRLGFLIKKRIT